jgi:hypothetical protein
VSIVKSGGSPVVPSRQMPAMRHGQQSGRRPLLRHKVNRIRFALFALTGALWGLAAVFLTTRIAPLGARARERSPPCDEGR